MRPVRHLSIISLCSFLVFLSCSKPPQMVAFPKDFKVGAERLTLGVMFDPSQPFIGKPNLINSSFGPGNPMDNFQHFFRVSFRDAVLRNSLFSRVAFTGDSIEMKSKGFSYKENYLEIKVPSEKLDRFVSDGIYYLMIVQKLTIDIVRNKPGQNEIIAAAENRKRNGAQKAAAVLATKKRDDNSPKRNYFGTICP